MATFILAIVITFSRYLFPLQSLGIHTSICYDTIYTWRSPLAPLAAPFAPLASSPLYPFPLTWHPPAVIGIVHLRLRLLVNWPYLPHPSPNCPSLSKFPEPRLTQPPQRLTTTTLGLFRFHYTEQEGRDGFGPIYRPSYVVTAFVAFGILAEEQN